MGPEAQALAAKMRSRRRFDFWALVLFTLVAIALAVRLNLHERLSTVLSRLEPWNVDELLVVLAILPFALVCFVTRRWQESVAVNRLLEASNAELRSAVAEVRTLRGIIPICASCKRIRDDEGYWHTVEKYVAAHTLAEFSHGLCADCMKKLYPEIDPGIPPGREGLGA
jgi:hypothetical protein